MAELLAKIESIPRVRVTVQDFALLDFAEQVKLSHSAGVFLSMHGAGVTHIVHAAIGAPNCCALIEMFPDSTTGFHTIWGFGNLARHLGMHYYRYEAKSGTTDATGTAVDIAEVIVSFLSFPSFHYANYCCFFDETMSLESIA